MEKSKKSILSGAFLLGLGTFIAKLLGAIYRIPLTRYLGGYGIGLYQMVFPLYTLLLDFSGAGIPNALSKLISEKNQEKRAEYAHDYLITAIKVLSVFGILATIFMASFSNIIAKAQGDINASRLYVVLSPSVFLVSLISCFRGYFQGLLKMSMTAISQIIEQFIKLCFGLIFVVYFYPNVITGVLCAVGAITVSEFVALIYLIVCYKRYSKKENLIYSFNKKNYKIYLKDIVKYVIPITLLGIFIPFSQVIDSFIIINFLSRYTENATSLYGLFSGVSLTVINLPISVCYGLAVVAVPYISSSKGKEKNKNSVYVLILTIIISLPCAILCYIFSPQIVGILFRRLEEIEKITVIKLIRILSPSIIFMSFLQSSNGILIGKGNRYRPLIGLSVGIVLKIILEIIFCIKPEINIYGGAIALISCYFIASVINFIFVIKDKKHNENCADKLKGC